MVSSIGAPFAIVLGVIAAVGLAIYALWDRAAGALDRVVADFGTELDRGGIEIPPERVAAVLALAAAGLWLAAAFAVRPDPLRAALFVPVAFGVAVFGFRTWVRRRAAARQKKFAEQLELALRLIANALRVGLGMRQALVVVVDEMPEPARGEFARVLTRTNIGVSLDDALADLVRRMPSDELRMMVDAIRMQTQTGGNLGRILDHLAATIKARRQIARKVLSLTGEARMSAWVIGFLPVGVGGFIMFSQPQMRTALLGTAVGHGCLIAFVTLEVLGVFVLSRVMRLDV
jgi:tight adherence protein B